MLEKIRQQFLQAQAASTEDDDTKPADLGKGAQSIEQPAKPAGAKTVTME